MVKFHHMVKKMKLINVDKLKDIISDTWILDRIDEQPIIDAVPVVRCKDCKFHGTNGDRLNCAIFCCTMPDEAFCSCGDRREDDGTTTD